jgi:hypothetical protein
VRAEIEGESFFRLRNGNIVGFYHLFNCATCFGHTTIFRTHIFLGRTSRTLLTTESVIGKYVYVKMVVWPKHVAQLNKPKILTLRRRKTPSHWSRTRNRMQTPKIKEIDLIFLQSSVSLYWNNNVKMTLFLFQCSKYYKWGHYFWAVKLVTSLPPPLFSRLS